MNVRVARGCGCGCECEVGGGQTWMAVMNHEGRGGLWV
jgi:hypothetical protein